MQPYRANVPGPACGLGLGCSKILALHIQSRGHPPGGSHTGAGRGLRRPLEGRPPAVRALGPSMIPWP